MSENKTHEPTEEELELMKQLKADREFLENADSKEIAKRIIGIMNVVQVLSTFVMTDLVTSTALLEILLKQGAIDSKEFQEVADMFAKDIQEGLVKAIEQASKRNTSDSLENEDNT